MNGFFDPNKYQQVQQVSEQYTRVPNYIFDDVVMTELSDKAFRCLMYIVRYTSGYNKTSAQIATSVFQKKCKIKRNETIYSCIHELEQLNLIKVERKNGVTNTYFLVQNHSHQTVLPPNRTTTVEQEGSSTVEQEGSSTVKPYPNKDKFKENFKESVSAQKSPKKQESPACEKTQKFSAMKLLLENEVSEQTAKEYLDLRAKKKKPVTDKVLKIVIHQAKHAQISNELAFQIIVVRGWDSFNATWSWQETANQIETLNLDFEPQPETSQQNYIAEPMEW